MLAQLSGVARFDGPPPTPTKIQALQAAHQRSLTPHRRLQPGLQPDLSGSVMVLSVIGVVAEA